MITYFLLTFYKTQWESKNEPIGIRSHSEPYGYKGMIYELSMPFAISSFISETCGIPVSFAVSLFAEKRSLRDILSRENFLAPAISCCRKGLVSLTEFTEALSFLFCQFFSEDQNKMQRFLQL